MKKTLIIVFHVLSLFALVVAFSVLYKGVAGNSGIAWISVDDYEQSPQFAEKFNNDVAGLKQYGIYANAFAPDGDIDESVVIIEANEGSGDVTYTLGDILKAAADFGIYLDETTNRVLLDGMRNPESSERLIRVNRKTYDPWYVDNLEPGPSQGIVNIKDLCVEVLKYIAEFRAYQAQYTDKASNLYYYVSYPSVDGDYVILSNTTLGANQIVKFERYMHFSGETGVLDTNVNPEPSSAYFVQSSEYGEGAVIDYDITVGIDTTYPYDDAYSQAARAYKGNITNTYKWIAAGIICLVIFIITLIFILADACAEDLEAYAKRHAIDRLPYEVSCVVCAFAAVLCYVLFKMTFCPAMDALVPSYTQRYWRSVVKVLITYGFIIILMRSGIRRYRKGVLYSNTMFSRLELAIEDYLENGKQSVTLFFKYFAFIIINVGLVALAVILYYRGMNGLNSRGIIYASLVFVALIITDCFVYNILFRDALQRDKIQGALKEVSDGNVENSLPEKEFEGHNLEMAKSINHISEGLASAVMDQVKSERLKADLITNVSHDIKTPLTSIINYVGLLKRENISSDTAKEYLDILEKKSERLKNLTEDLVEASKASSGNIRMEPAKIDIVELTEQAAAEFEDKFAKRGLEFVFEDPGHPVFAYADGRHLWRIFENLLNNASKYSLHDTRIYGDVYEDTGDLHGLPEDKKYVRFTVKNISEMKLNISPDELTERFVRGDISRTTEGSGLGLSIAKSLATLMGGKLVIEIDGDLYKANVILPAYDESMALENNNEKGTVNTDENQTH
ncbi:MAG: HAMP domain-containing sensor histidine kinase [Eubacteriales bacterium]|nr:HAMP domain-containing sensor histidine kinase [Eubacteriales bacterium]